MTPAQAAELLEAAHVLLTLTSIITGVVIGHAICWLIEVGRK